MVVEVHHLPSSVSCSDIVVDFGINVSCHSLSRVWRQSSGFISEIQVQTPVSQTGSSITPTMYVLNNPGREQLVFPAAFTYLVPPAPVIDAVVPAEGCIFTANAVRISVSNLPSLTVANVRVTFVWANGLQRNASAVAVAQSEQSATKELQTWEVDVLTPVGTGVVEGSVSLKVVHAMHMAYASVLKQSAFTFFDPSMPKVIRMESADFVAVDELRVAQSKETQFKLHVEKVPSSVPAPDFVALVGNAPEPIIFTTRDSTARTAQIVLVAQASEVGGRTNGMIIFGSPPPSCVSLCCADMSCKQTCPDVKFACFALQYYDDALPEVTFLSDLVGPEVGKDMIKMRVTNFPLMNSAAEAAVFFGQGENRTGTLVLSQQTDDFTELVVVTPEYPLMDDEPMKTVAVRLVPDARPDDRTVTFEYTYQAVNPELVSLMPTSGPNGGGYTVQVSIDYFPFPADGGIQILFNGDELESSKIQVFDVSDRLNTFLSFVTPASPPGEATVRVAPMTCGQPCRHAVFFTFL